MCLTRVKSSLFQPGFYPFVGHQNVIFIQFYPDESAVEFERSQRGCSRTHEGVEDDSIYWTASLDGRGAQFFWERRIVGVFNGFGVNLPDRAFVPSKRIQPPFLGPVSFFIGIRKTRGV